MLAHCNNKLAQLLSKISFLAAKTKPSREIVSSETKSDQEVLVPFVGNLNAPQKKDFDNRKQLLQNGWRQVDLTHKLSEETHLSNGEYLIHKVPVIRVHDEVVRCIGGTDLETGHPQVYIQLNTRTVGQPVSCKYCGLRYALEH